jgi:integrase/recombinase XerC
MTMRVRLVDGAYRLDGDWDGLDAANEFLTHSAGRGFSAATVRAYAFDVANLVRFLTERGLTLSEVEPALVFDWIDWQGVRRSGRRGGGWVALGCGIDGQPSGGGGARLVRVLGDDRPA